jgi:hypothetical protein
MAEESPRDKARHAPREGHASRHPYLNTPHTRWRETRAGIGGGRRRLEGACERASGEAGEIERERERENRKNATGRKYIAEIALCRGGVGDGPLLAHRPYHVWQGVAFAGKCRSAAEGGSERARVEKWLSLPLGTSRAPRAIVIIYTEVRGWEARFVR